MTSRVVLAVGLASLVLAAPGQAKQEPVAAFKLLSGTGTQTYTFQEKTTDIKSFDDDGNLSTPPIQTRVDICTGSGNVNLRYRTAKPTKMFVTLRKAHGLHTLISDTPDPDSGLDFLTTAGQMTLSKSMNYTATDECRVEPVECPETTFSAPVLVFGTHERLGGISSLYDTNLNLPSGLDRSCQPRPGTGFGPINVLGPQPEEFATVIPRSDLFDEKKKRLSGEDSIDLSYEVAADPEAKRQVSGSGTYTETIAVELKRLKLKK